MIYRIVDKLTEKEQINVLLKFLVNNLKEDLVKNPYFIVTEADFQGYLYSKLLLKEELQPLLFDETAEKRANFRIHLEYPRYIIKKETDKLAKGGRYDIAILPEHDSLHRRFEKDIPDQKLVWIGFELKTRWNVGAGQIRTDLENDIPAFWLIDEKGNKKIPSKYGIMFHLNVARKKKKSDETFQKISKEMREYRKKFPNLFCVYVESYRENNKPEVLAYPSLD